MNVQMMSIYLLQQLKNLPVYKHTNLELPVIIIQQQKYFIDF